LTIFSELFSIGSTILDDDQYLLITISSRVKNFQFNYNEDEEPLNSAGRKDKFPFHLQLPTDQNTNTNERKFINDGKPYSKLSISLACGLIDCLLAWDNILNTLPPSLASPLTASIVPLFCDAYNHTTGVISSAQSNAGADVSSKIMDSEMKQTRTLSTRSKIILSELHMETSGGPASITATAHFFDQACCCRITKILADYLGKHSMK
jgi:hypothetical protein